MPSIDLTPYYQPQGSTSDGTKYDNGLGLIQSTMNALDNNNIAANAAIVASKLNGLATVVGTQNVGSANTDLATPGASRSALYVVTTGTGTLRSIGAPTENGSRVLVRNGSGSSFTLKHQLAGGTGAQLYLRTVADVTLLDKEIVEFAYDGTNWVEVNRDQAATAAGNTPGTQLDYAQITSAPAGVTATTEGTAPTVITGNAITYDGSRLLLEFFFPKNTATIDVAMTAVFVRDGSAIGQVVTDSNGGAPSHMKGSLFDTPAAGSHTYSVKAFTSGGTLTISAGAGGAGVLVPAFLRVTKA